MIEKSNETIPVSFYQCFNVSVEPILIEAQCKGLFLLQRPQSVHNAIHDHEPHLIFLLLFDFFSISHADLKNAAKDLVEVCNSGGNRPLDYDFRSLYRSYGLFEDHAISSQYWNNAFCLSFCLFYCLLLKLLLAFSCLLYLNSLRLWQIEFERDVVLMAVVHFDKQFLIVNSLFQDSDTLLNAFEVLSKLFAKLED